MGNHKYSEMEKEFKRLKNLGMNYGRFKNSWEDYLEELIYLENKYIFNNISESEYQRILDQEINIGKFHNHEGGGENLGELSWIIIQDNPEFIENINQFLNNLENLDEYRFNLELIEKEDFHLIEKFYYDHNKEFESFIIHQELYYVARKSTRTS